MAMVGWVGLGRVGDGSGEWYASETKPRGLVASRMMPEHLPSAK